MNETDQTKVTEFPSPESIGCKTSFLVTLAQFLAGANPSSFRVVSPSMDCEVNKNTVL